MNYADDYKRIDFYERHSQGVKDGFHSFTVKGEHFFTFHIRGKIYLVSESYSSKRSRDNGIASVKKNMKLKDRYKFSIPRAGKYYFFLVAGNNQSIAKSNSYGTEMTRHKGAQVIRDYKSTGGSKKPSSASKKTTTKKKAVKKTTAQKPKTTVKTSKTKVTKMNGMYHKTDLNYKIFKSSNDNYYFTFRDSDENAVLMNNSVRGFKTLAAAKDSLAKVLDHGPSRSNYEIKETKNGKFYFFLKDDNKKNIGKSFFYSNRRACNAAIALLVSGKGGSGAKKSKSSTSTASKSKKASTSATKAASKKTSMSKSSAGSNDYLPINRYDGKTGVHFFESKNGSSYFGYNGRSGTYLRSEGYSSKKARLNGIKSVIKNSKNDSRWASEKLGSKWYYFLKAGNGQEIGRSGGYDSEAAMKSDFSAAKRNLSGLSLDAIPAEKIEKKAAAKKKSGAPTAKKSTTSSNKSSSTIKKATTGIVSKPKKVKKIVEPVAKKSTAKKPVVKKSTTKKTVIKKKDTASKPSPTKSPSSAGSAGFKAKSTDSTSSSTPKSSSDSSSSKVKSDGDSGNNLGTGTGNASSKSDTSTGDNTAVNKSDNLRVVPRSTDTTSSASKETGTSDKSSSSSSTYSDKSMKNTDSSEKSSGSLSSSSTAKEGTSSYAAESKKDIKAVSEEKPLIERDKGMGCSPWWLLLLLIPLIWGLLSWKVVVKRNLQLLP